MQIPDRLKILGLDYTVKLLDDNETGWFGSHNGSTQIIRLNINKHPDQIASTLLHEIIEALNMHCELALTHNQMSALEAGLYQVLKGNKLSF